MYDQDEFSPLFKIICRLIDLSIDAIYLFAIVAFTIIVVR